MTNRSLSLAAAALNKIRSAYGRERAAARLMESREKTMLELGNLAHYKIRTGQISDPELTALSQTVEQWDGTLRRLLDPSGSAAAAQPEDDEFVASADEPDGVRKPLSLPWRNRAAATGKHGLFGALLSVVLMLLMCYAINATMNKVLDNAAAAARQTAADKVQEKLNDLLPAEGTGRLGARVADRVRELAESKLSDLTSLQRSVDFDLLDVPTTYLLLNNVRSDARIQLGNDLVSAGMQVRLGLYAFLLLPLIALFAGGYAAAWRMRLSSAADAALLSIGIGAAYALFLALLTRMSGFSAAMELPLAVGSVDVSYGFSAASALFNGFVLGTTFSLAGALFRLKPFKFTSLLAGAGGISYGEPVHRAVFAVVCGVGLSLLYVLVVLWAKGGLTALTAALLPQLAVYLWTVANGAAFHITDFIEGGSKPAQISVLSGIRGSGLEAYAGEWNLFIALSALLPIVVLVAAGMRMRTARGNAHTIIFSAIYGAIMATMAAMTSIGLTLRGDSAITGGRSFAVEAGLSSPATFAACFIAACIFTWLGKQLGQSMSRRRNRTLPAEQHESRV